MSLRVPTLLLALVVSSVALGQEPEVVEEAEPQGRAARLSFIAGEVSFQAEDAQAPEPAVLNHPVASGDRLMTADESKAELTLGVAAIRLDERTDMSVAHLEEDGTQLEVNSGTVSVHVREMGEQDAFEIQTPGSTIRLLRPGEYRVDVQEDGSAVLAVRSGGDAEIDSGAGEGPVRVQDNQQVRLARGEQFAAFEDIDRRDPFEEWSRDRERELTASESSRYVSNDVVGYEDLDRYGSWYSEPDYGYVWVPRHTFVGWEPYRYGRWVWVSRFGWTWIDDSPWGFAPFHYGRWAFVRDRWCWVPGPRYKHHYFNPGRHHSRPHYAPRRPWKGGLHDSFPREAFSPPVRRDHDRDFDRGRDFNRGRDRNWDGDRDRRWRTRPELGKPNLGRIERGERHYTIPRPVDRVRPPDNRDRNSRDWDRRHRDGDSYIRGPRHDRAPSPRYETPRNTPRPWSNGDRHLRNPGNGNHDRMIRSSPPPASHSRPSSPAPRQHTERGGGDRRGGQLRR